MTDLIVSGVVYALTLIGLVFLRIAEGITSRFQPDAGTAT